jgi:hypothetical protein
LRASFYAHNFLLNQPFQIGSSFQISFSPRTTHPFKSTTTLSIVCSSSSIVRSSSSIVRSSTLLQFNLDRSSTDAIANLAQTATQLVPCPHGEGVGLYSCTKREVFDDDPYKIIRLGDQPLSAKGISSSHWIYVLDSYDDVVKAYSVYCISDYGCTRRPPSFAARHSTERRECPSLAVSLHPCW